MRRICVIAFVCLMAALAVGQVNYTPMPVPKMQFADSNGVPLAGGFVYTYAAGSSTPQATWTDYTGAVQSPNPIPLDSAGRAAIFLGNLSYKFVVQNSAYVTQWTVDGVSPIGAVLAAPPAIGSVTPGPVTATTVLAQLVNATGATPFEVNGNPLNFTNLAGWPGAGIPNSTGWGWSTSYGVIGTGAVVLSNSPTLVTPNIGAATATSLNMTAGGAITNTGTITPQTAGTPSVGTAALPFGSMVVGPSPTANVTLSCPSCTTQVAVDISPVGGTIPVLTAGSVSFTPGTGVSSASCATATCTNVRGEISLSVGTFTGGTLVTMSWPATPSAYVCTATQNGSGTGSDYIIGNSVATNTGMTVTSAAAGISSAVVLINYSCQP